MGAGATGYSPLGTGTRLRNDSSPEADLQLKYRTAGVMDRMFAKVTANATSASSTIRSRKNTANGNLVLTIGAGATGLFEDLTNSDTVAVADLFAHQTAVGAGGTLTCTYIGCMFTPAAGSPTTAKLAGNTSSLITGPAGTTQFFTAGGTLGFTTTEANTQLKVNAAYTAAFLHTNVDGNTRSDTTTLRFRKNGANGNQVISIGAGATGLFEDTTNTDTLAKDDLINFAMTFGAGTGTLYNAGASCASFELSSQPTPTYMMAQQGISGAAAASSTNYLILFGSLDDLSAAEADVQLKQYVKVTLSYAEIRVLTNGTSGSSTLNLRNNGANAGPTISIGAGATGLFQDTTNSAVVVPGDLVNWQLIVAAGGTMTFAVVAIGATGPTSHLLSIIGVGG